MKKAGIITQNGHFNHGNRLQNYALQAYLYNEFQVNSETIWSLSIIRFLKEKIKLCINLLKSKRTRRFVKFSRKYINSKFYLSNNVTNKYDYMIVGSDQVWNPFYSLTNIEDLSFYKSCNKIAYAASFGADEIPEHKYHHVKNEIAQFKSISVREDSGKKIIEELTSRKDVEVLIDPTMLLTKEEWDKVSKKPSQLKADKYILNYFWGNLSEERKKKIEEVAKENNCEIINILDKQSPFYNCNPSEFLYLEKHAFLICTDSFHSCVFAILYDRPFVIFNREDDCNDMSSRLETLLNKFELKNRKFTGKITKANLEHDYTRAYQILEKERKKSKKFLEKALDIK